MLQTEQESPSLEMTNLFSPIVQSCDAISGSRPGARREDSESYIKRLQDLEKLATSFNGVENAFAIQAGRELRVIVDSESLDDKSADLLSFDISQKQLLVHNQSKNQRQGKP